MGKDQELLQAVKTEDLLTVQKLLQRPRPGKATLCPYDSALLLFIFYRRSKITLALCRRKETLTSSLY
ncbi:Caskin-1 [Dissostichus eleginoides]|uniref:Caskin-1 n=1 Tax=Dissostichus eleginoides TaxID=100907 RepID=A0AAD9BAN6_DISEL|nr:Caskin-1 [Dissostichus eleginoides]